MGSSAVYNSRINKFENTYAPAQKQRLALFFFLAKRVVLFWRSAVYGTDQRSLFQVSVKPKKLMEKLVRCEVRIQDVDLTTPHKTRLELDTADPVSTNVVPKFL